MNKSHLFKPFWPKRYKPAATSRHDQYAATSRHDQYAATSRHDQYAATSRHDQYAGPLLMTLLTPAPKASSLNGDMLQLRTPSPMIRI
ncbi:hypothetical protein FKM82_023131 [Ascaphus truei]